MKKETVKKMKKAIRLNALIVHPMDGMIEKVSLKNIKTKYLVNNMKKMFYFLIVTLFFSCKNNAQNSYIFDKIPLDTTKWVATDTLLIQLNEDKYKDVVLIFDKYRALTRPDNIQTPVLFYLGSENKNFSFIEKSESIIYSPHFEIKVLNDEFIIIQKGMENDNNIYTNIYKYQDNKIVTSGH